MTIDIIFLVLMLAAIIKGWQRGLIVAIFSVLAFIAGIAAAIKLSAVVANYLKDHTQISSKWLPILAFVLVFLGVALFIRWCANLLQAAISFAMMEWLNKLGGIILYAALYTALFSIILFYGTWSHIISPAAIASSKIYTSIEPWGMAVINTLGKMVPFFKDMFLQLEDFFGKIAQ